MIGTKLGDYEIIRLMGRGGMGSVYEALNPRINRRVAIKLLHPDYVERSDVVRRFENEARAVNTINHPGVVQVSEIGQAPDGSLYLVMELLEGETLLNRLVRSNGRLPEEDLVTICWQLAGVLAAAHAKNIVHRDLKPGNVMLVPDLAGPEGERVKLLDFGIAKLGAEHAQSEDAKSRTGEIIGTAAYMSPEQLAGDKPVDGQSDVYSLGVVMFRMRSGRLPFLSNSGEVALAMMHMLKPPPPLQELDPDTSPWLAQLINTMLRKQPEERPTMAQVASELQEHAPFSRPSLRVKTIGFEQSGPLSMNKGDSFAPFAKPIDYSVSYDIPTIAEAPGAETPGAEAPGAQPPGAEAPGASDWGHPPSGSITNAIGQLRRSTLASFISSHLWQSAVVGAMLLLGVSMGGTVLIRRVAGPAPAAASWPTPATSPLDPTPPGRPPPERGAQAKSAGLTSPGAATTARQPSGAPGKDPSQTKRAVGKKGSKKGSKKKGKPRPASKKRHSTKIIH